MVVLVAIGKNDGYAVLNDGEIKMAAAANGERERERKGDYFPSLGRGQTYVWKFRVMATSGFFFSSLFFLCFCLFSFPPSSVCFLVYVSVFHPQSFFFIPPTS